LIKENYIKGDEEEDKNTFSNPFCNTTSNGANDDVLIFLQLVILTFYIQNTFRSCNSQFINKDGFTGVGIIIIIMMVLCNLCILKLVIHCNDQFYTSFNKVVIINIS